MEAEFERNRMKVRAELLKELKAESEEVGELLRRRWTGISVVAYQGLSESTLSQGPPKEEGGNLPVPAEICLFLFSLSTGLLEETVEVWTMAVEEAMDPLVHGQILCPASSSQSIAAQAWTVMDKDRRRFPKSARPASKVAKQLQEYMEGDGHILVEASEWDLVLGAMAWLQRHLPLPSPASAQSIADPNRFRCAADVSSAMAAYAAFAILQKPLPSYYFFNDGERIPWCEGEPMEPPPCLARVVDLRGYPERCDFHGRQPEIAQLCATAAAARLVKAAVAAFERSFAEAKLSPEDEDEHENEDEREPSPPLPPPQQSPVPEVRARPLGLGRGFNKLRNKNN